MKANNVVFVVENNHLHEQLIKENFSKDHSHEFRYFTSSAACLSHLKEHPMAVLIDHDLKTINKQERDAIVFLDKIKELDHHTQVVFFSENESKELAQDMMQHGAYDYVVVNPNSYLRLQKALSNIERSAKHKKQADKHRLLTLISLAIYLLFILFIGYLYFKGYIHENSGELLEP